MNTNDQRFPKSHRVRTRSDFQRIYLSNLFVADDVLVIRGCPNNTSFCRLGLSVSRKVGSAVVRNRWKRIIREVFRKNKQELPAGIDLVIRPRKGAHVQLRVSRKINGQTGQTDRKKDTINAMSNRLAYIRQLPARFLIASVKMYQLCLSPLLGNNCRFTPTCSAYFITAVKKYGAIRGALKGAWRICRCNPWNKGGYDPP